MPGWCGRFVVTFTCATALEAGAAVAVDTVRTRMIDAETPFVTDAVLYFDFAAESGGAAGVVQDVSGHAHEGVSAGCVWSADGRFAGGAMGFTGNGSSIVVYAAPDFTMWERYSASIWFRHDGLGDTGPQYGHKILDRTSLGHDWHLSLVPEGAGGEEGRLGLHLYEEGRRLSLTDRSCNWCDGAWHHAVVVRDGTRGELWIDGARRAETREMFGVRGEVPFCIGNSRSADRLQRKGWSGQLDEVRLFERALDAGEIAGLYERGAIEAGGDRVVFAADVAMTGSLTVAGPAVFSGGARCLRTRGDLVSDNGQNGSAGHAE